MPGSTFEELIELPLFQDVPDQELSWVAENSQVESLRNGAVFHQENQPVDKFYVVIEGELQVTRRLNGKEVVVGTTPQGIMGGELALLNGTDSPVTARAILPSRLLVLDQAAFRQLFTTCPTLSARIFRTAAERMQGFANYQKQQEKMAALGKLAAGLAHELNNPSAAVRRTVTSLAEALPDLEKETVRLCRIELTDEQMEYLVTIPRDAIPGATAVKLLLPLEQSESEEEIGGWLESIGIDRAWDLAANFVNAGLSLSELQELAEEFPRDSLPVVLNWLSSALCINGLLDEIKLSTNRISELVGAVKAYTYMDQAPVQQVDIHQGLENTLKVMSYKLRNVEVIRELDPDLPQIQGRGGELNQVWTNLIDNAVEAMHGEGKLWLITRSENDFVMVEVADNGPGIPEEVIPHLFEPFYTTKDVGTGTGLGLDISYRIIKQHSGTIEVQSNPGRTRFIVRIPVRGIEMS